ncbi:MAG TPA: hypothetical protein VMH87_11045 [Pseudomonadales bacterium]|nr:hypothetical protein [Pseudomonadales bacterium]
MKWKPIIFTTLGIVVVALLFFPTQIYFLFYPHTQNDVVMQVFKDREIFSVIQTPQSVTAQLLHSKNGGSDTLAGYTKDALVGLSPEQIQAIQKLLEKPASYSWGIGNNCIPDYGVLLNFRLQGDTVRVALCFKCNMMGVFEGDDDGAAQINREYLFEPMRSQLIAICKQIFPNDKEIQALQ